MYRSLAAAIADAEARGVSLSTVALDADTREAEIHFTAGESSR